ncbi:hypothetical protein YC2023_036466 [Brassica napus]
MATFGNTPLNFQNNTINTSSFKCFFSLQIVQKLPCLRILSFWGVETRNQPSNVRSTVAHELTEPKAYKTYKMSNLPFLLFYI